MYIYINLCVLFEAFDIPQWIHVFLLLVPSSTFADFQVLTAQTDREENVNNKIRATTHVLCMVHDQEGQRKATGQYLLSNSNFPLKKIKPVTVIVIQFQPTRKKNRIVVII